MAVKLDAMDAKILRRLQEDASQTAAEIGASVGLSSNACWRRIKAMEEAGLIRKRVALLDPARLGLGVTVFVSVRSPEHSAEWQRKFTAMVQAMPEVVEFYRLAGQTDYLLKLQVGDIAAYDRLYKQMIDQVQLCDVTASFAMEELKHTTALPVTSGLF